MRRRSKRDRHVELFNFSFLDILACVIGLLIFILTIVVVSGGRLNGRQDARKLVKAQQQLQDARAAAQVASLRRSNDEQMLKSRSQDYANPTAATDAIRDQILSLGEETAYLESAASIANAKQSSLEKALADLKQLPANNSDLDNVRQKTKQFNEITIALSKQLDEQQKTNAKNVQIVQYYVPHVHEVQRATVWVEVLADKLWCVRSDDYIATSIDEDSTRFSRLHTASGTPVDDLVRGRATVPKELASAVPENTVLEVALHSDSYKSFRLLRDWAWSKGFGVNWIPHDDDSIILTHAEHVYEQ